MKKISFLLTFSTLLLAFFTNCNKDVAVTDVLLNENYVTLNIGETKKLTATVLPENATNKTVTWISSNPAVATVTQEGFIEALGYGITTIVVTTVEGNYWANCNVNVAAPYVPTKEDLITQENGWLLTAATSFPAFVNWMGISSENLFVSFFYECELDDILYFKKNYSQIINSGKMLCEPAQAKEISLGNWRIIKDEEVLEFQLPYFFTEDDYFVRLEAKIMVLNDNTLILRLPLMFDDGLKIGKRVFTSQTKTNTCYEFTLTYTKNHSIGK